MKKVRVILNGKGAANPQVRAAINQIREEGQPLEVRCTWEGGDAARFAQESMSDGIDVLVAGGGDGTINEVVNGILEADTSPRMALAVLPLGTANAFLDDGLMDVMAITDFQTKDLGLVVQESQDFTNRDNNFVHYRQVPAFEIEVPGEMPINLDGEPHRWDHIKFELLPKCLPVVLPQGCPLIQGG